MLKFSWLHFGYYDLICDLKSQLLVKYFILFQLTITIFGYGFISISFDIVVTNNTIFFWKYFSNNNFFFSCQIFFCKVFFQFIYLGKFSIRLKFTKISKTQKRFLFAKFFLILLLFLLLLFTLQFLIEIL